MAYRMPKNTPKYLEMPDLLSKMHNFALAIHEYA